MNLSKFKKLLCAMLVCSQVFIGGLVAYGNGDAFSYDEVAPRSIGSPRPIGK